MRSLIILDMEKYYLQPTWDIIPAETGLTLVSIDSEEIFLKNRKGYPPLIKLPEALLKGVTLAELSLSNLLPADELKAILDRLIDIGLVVVDEADTNKVGGYLGLLNRYVIGHGKIVAQNQRLRIDQHNPLSQLITISQAVGFGAHFINYQSSLSEGLGADKNPILADIKAVVEAVERYALSNYDLPQLRLSTWEKIKSSSLSPKQLGTTEKRLIEAGQIHWHKLSNIDSSQHLYLPIDRSYHPVDYRQLGRKPVCPINISGVAGHQTKEAAMTNALLELCEHEALMVAWYGKRTTPTINPKSIKRSDQVYIRLLEQMGWQIIIKNISLDLAPVVMVIGIGPQGKRALTIGSCAAFSLRYAVSKALSEVVRSVLQDEVNRPEFTLLDKSDVNDTLTHGHYYARHEHINEAAHLWESGEMMPANDLLTHGPLRGMSLSAALKVRRKNDESHLAELNYLLRDVLQWSGVEAYFADLTPSEIKETPLPLYVVRAVCPEMARLTVGYRAQPAKTERFLRLVSSFGSGGVNNRSVHPFS